MSEFATYFTPLMVTLTLLLPWVLTRRRWVGISAPCFHGLGQDYQIRLFQPRGVIRRLCKTFYSPDC